MGSENLLVALLAKEFENKVLQALAEYRALRLPQNKPLPDPVDYREQPELLAELAVVAQFRLLHLLEVAFKLLFGGKSRSIDALELLVFFVSAVVCPRD